MKLTNVHGISLPLAVWLLYDDYDYSNESNVLSATSLLKSTRQLVLSRRVNQSDREIDISTFLAARHGTAIHDSIEKAWRKSGVGSMKKLGYPDKIADNIRVNPTDQELAENKDIIPVWIEKRVTREIDGYKISGKFDMVMDGRLFDTKTTSVYAYLLGRKDDDYAMQGGIYRWLNPELITDEHVFIQFIFTDWQKAQANRNPDYPQAKALEYPVAMPSLEEVERFIRNKLTALKKNWDVEDAQIPYCTDKELWRTDDSYKYYTDPTKTQGRSNRSFNNLAEANAYKASKGGVGVVITIPGEVRACDYCPAFSICKQKDNYYVS